MTSTAQVGDQIRFAWEPETQEFMVAYYEAKDDAWYTQSAAPFTREACEDKVAALNASRDSEIAKFEAEAADARLHPESRELSAQMALFHRAARYRIVSRPISAWTIVA